MEQSALTGARRGRAKRPAPRGWWLELLGWAGLLGLGWMRNGHFGVGILLLLVWWLWSAVGFVVLAGAALFSRALFFGLLGFYATVWALIPPASAWGARRQLSGDNSRSFQDSER